MIVTLTPNPAVDVTYRVAELEPGESHRVEAPRRRAGGKGVNTASVLAAFGLPHRCAALVEEALVAWWDTDLRSREVEPLTEPVPAPFRTRTSTAVVGDAGDATLLNEAGGSAPPARWEALVERVLDILAGGDAVATPETTTGHAAARPVLTVSGSLAPGTPVPALLDLVEQALAAGAAVVVDGSGDWLRAVLPLRPTLVRPNAVEARESTGEDDPVAAARALVRAGAHAAMVSSGSAGAVLQTADDLWWGRPGERLHGNPTGAGDAATAAAAAHLSTHVEADWPELIRETIGWSGAAVLQELACELDPVDARRLAATALVGEGRPES